MFYLTTLSEHFISGYIPSENLIDDQCFVCMSSFKMRVASPSDLIKSVYLFIY